jgi:hypothetical protein
VRRATTSLETLESRVLFSAFGGTPWAVPGLIQAENFDTGGEGVAYHDMTTANDGARYRTADAPDISDFGYLDDRTYAVGWNAPGEWLQYTVNVTTAGTYMLGARISSTAGTGSISVSVDGADATGPMALPNTGNLFEGWTT